MNISVLRKYLYAFGLPILWWSSVSLSSLTVGGTLLAAELEFIPITLHALRAADYSSDPLGLTIAPIDLSIIKEALKDRIAIEDPPENFDNFPEAEASTANSQNSQDDSSNRGFPPGSPSNPPPADEPNPDDGSGDSPPDDPGSDDDPEDKPGKGKGKGPGDHPNDGQGQDKPKGNGNNTNQT